MNGDKKGMNAGSAMGVAAAAAATAAAAAGAYWLYGAKDAAKNRKKAKSFMLKARADVMDAVERMQDIDKTQYLAVVDKVVSKYGAAAGVTSAEIAQMTKDLRAAWAHMQAARGTVKKAAKKTVKKAAPKKKKAAKKS